MALGLSTRKSALAAVKQVDDATPVAPTSGTDFTALQSDFSMTPSAEELVSAENQSSIGQSRTVAGGETPEASFTHYIRGSGVEGVPVDFSEFIEGAFGTVEVNATEYNTVSGSTVSAINVDTGEGVNFERGQGLLIKDGVNGYSVRNVLSVAGDVLTLGFNTPFAAGTGVNLGKAIHYKPSDDAHPALSLWHYIANGGNVQMMAGSKITEMSITFEAGQFITASFTAAGIAYYWNPIEITASSRFLDFDDGAEKVATLAVRFYSNPHDLASAIQTAMNAVSTGITVTYVDATGKFNITKASGTLSLLFATGDNLANSIAPKIGFAATDVTGVLTYTGGNPAMVAASYTPTYDSAQPLVAKNNEVLLGDADDITCFGAQRVTFTLTNERAVIPDICEESGQVGAVFTGRSVEITVRALLKAYESDKFRRFRDGVNTAFAYNAGNKSGGNWVAGTVSNLYAPNTTITSFEVTDADGLAVLDMTLRPYVDSGLGEIYYNNL